MSDNAAFVAILFLIFGYWVVIRAIDAWKDVQLTKVNLSEEDPTEVEE